MLSFKFSFKKKKGPRGPGLDFSWFFPGKKEIADMVEMAQILKLKTVYTCPKCGSRGWLVVQYGSDEAICECAECGWDCELDSKRWVVEDE